MNDWKSPVVGRLKMNRHLPEPEGWFAKAMGALFGAAVWVAVTSGVLAFALAGAALLILAVRLLFWSIR